MDFGTFLLYFLGAVVALVVGWNLLWLLFLLLGASTVRAVDGVNKKTGQRANAKWERIEAEIENEDDPN